jgi:hypothetical protein
MKRTAAAPQRRFKFSSEAQSEIQQALGAKTASILPLLATVICQYEQPRSDAVISSRADTGDPEVKDLCALARRLVVSVDEMNPATLRRLGNRVAIASLYDLANNNCRSAADYVEALRRSAKDALLALEPTNYGSARPGRRQTPRRALAADVALVLRSKSIGVTRGRNGAFAKVLHSVLHDMSASQTSDVFHLIKPAADFVNTLSLDECRIRARAFE